MDCWHSLADVPEGHGPSVVAVGNFDGVHRGHRKVLSRLVGLASTRSARSVAITFAPHPLHVLHPERAPALITSPSHKLALMAATGLDATLVLPFTRELAAWTPLEFVRDVIVDRLGAVAVAVGHDVRFGVNNSGDLTTMRELGGQLGFDVEVLDDATGVVLAAGSDGSGGSVAAPGRRWSSSWVRELLAAGDVAAAAEVLGRPHRVTGEVVHGDHRGRELGYPTANLSQDAEGLVPADGVYAGWLLRTGLDELAADRLLPAAVSIGTNPTFDGTQRRVEAYVLDRTDLDLYGEVVAVELVERLRPTVRYDSLPELLEQMARDVQRCREILTVVSPG